MQCPPESGAERKLPYGMAGWPTATLESAKRTTATRKSHRKIQNSRIQNPLRALAKPVQSRVGGQGQSSLHRPFLPTSLCSPGTKRRSLLACETLFGSKGHAAAKIDESGDSPTTESGTSRRKLDSSQHLARLWETADADDRTAGRAFPSRRQSRRTAGDKSDHICKSNACFS